MLHVLVADTDASIANLMQQMVHSERAQITHVSSGDAILNLTQEHEPGLIVLSTDIPKGLFWCGKIRKNAGSSHVPLVVIYDPTHQKTIEQHQGLAVCATAYEAAPLDHEAALALLRRFVPDVLRADNEEAVRDDGVAPAVPSLDSIEEQGAPSDDSMENLAAAALDMEEKERLERQLESAQEALNEVQKRSSEIQTQFAEEAEIQAAVELENDALRDRIRSLEEDANSLEQDYSNREETLSSSQERTEFEVQNLRALLESLQHRYEERQVLSERLQAENERLKDQVHQLDNEFKRSQDNVRRLDEDMKVLQEARDQIIGRLEETQSNLDQRSRELRQSEDFGEARNRELVELRDSLAAATRERTELLPILQRREQELQETRDKLRDAARDVEAAQLSVEEKQHEVELERQNAKDLRHRFGEMERLMDSVNMEKEALRDQVAATEVEKQKALKRVNEIERAARAKIQEWADTKKVYEATQKHLTTQRDSLVNQLEKLTRNLEHALGDLASQCRQSSDLVKTVRNSAQDNIPGPSN